jgi:hypothetical protein
LTTFDLGELCAGRFIVDLGPSVPVEASLSGAVATEAGAA